jgi:hypothetical protein
VINIVTDLILAVVPAPIFWSLQIQRRAKIVLTCIMGLGILWAAKSTFPSENGLLMLPSW